MSIPTRANFWCVGSGRAWSARTEAGAEYPAKLAGAAEVTCGGRRGSRAKLSDVGKANSPDRRRLVGRDRYCPGCVPPL
jgi:hypothetical protein